MVASNDVSAGAIFCNTGITKQNKKITTLGQINLKR
jgi:hypothetical protein